MSGDNNWAHHPKFDNPILACCGDRLSYHDYDGCHGRTWDGSGCECMAHLIVLAQMADVGEMSHTHDAYCAVCAGSCGGES